jgi:hypothetical protein
MKNTPMTISVSESFRDELKIKAAAARKSISQYVIDAVQAVLDSDKSIQKFVKNKQSDSIGS